MHHIHIKKSQFLLFAVVIGGLSIISYGLVTALASESGEQSSKQHFSKSSITSSAPEDLSDKGINLAPESLDTSTPCLDAGDVIGTSLTSVETIEPVTRAAEDQITAIPYDPEWFINRTEIGISTGEAPQEGCDPVPETPIDETR